MIPAGTDKIQKAFLESSSEEDAYLSLLKDGFKVSEINLAYYSFLKQKNKQQSSHLSASKVLLYLGALITILGGIIYIGINWSGWNQIVRILAIFLPMVTVLMIGSLLWFKKTYLKQAIIFIFTGSLLFPLFLGITFNELHIYKNSLDYFCFSISLLTFIFYLTESLIFPYPVWSFLSPLVALFVYHFGLSISGVAQVFPNASKAWAYILPSFIYILLAFYYLRNNLAERAKYLLLIGEVAGIFSLIFILVNSFINKTDGWFIFTPLTAYFLIATIFEKSSKKDESSTLYSISLIGFFAVIGRLAIDGSFLDLVFTKTQLSSQSLIGGSIIIAGVIYLLISQLLFRLKNFGLEKPSLFANFFETIGVLAFLQGIFYSSLGGKKIIIETALLLSSLTFIFVSVFNQSRPYLYIGTLYLIVYIFDIGGEYFQNQVGWPLTLFVAGLVSMGIGFAIKKIRREYFKQAP